MQVVIEKTLISYSDDGKGPVLLCVHGWMDSKHAFKELTQQLDSEYRIISLDLPNFGGSQITDAIVTIADYAHFLADFVKKLDIKDYVLVGHSMGCQIAVYAVGSGILHPKKLILLSAAGVRNKNTVLKKLLRYLSVKAKPVVPKKLKKKFYKRIGSDYDPDFSTIHKNIINNSLKTDVQAQAAHISVLTLLVNGNQDRSTPLWMAESLNATIKGSTLEIVKNGDHWIHQKHPDVIAGMIRIFTQ
jgi:pimeloyl-ACP methyl ester carboxylesterase